MSRQPNQVSVETRVSVVAGTAYFLGVIILLSILAASTLSGSARITTTFLIGTFALSTCIVYLIRTYRFLQPVFQVLWHRSSLYTQNDLLPPKKLYKVIKTAFSNNLRLDRQLVYLPSERYIAFQYFLIAAIGGLLVQLFLLTMFSTPENLKYATEILEDGHSFSLLVAAFSLINPIIGASVLLISLLGASGEETPILIAIVGIPAATVTPGMWNAIALLEVLQYDLIRRIERTMKQKPILLELMSEFLNKDFEETYRMVRPLTVLAYLAFLVVFLCLSAVPLGVFGS